MLNNISEEQKNVAADISVQLETINRTIARATELSVRVDITPIIIETEHAGKLRQLTGNCVIVLSTTHPLAPRPRLNNRRVDVPTHESGLSHISNLEAPPAAKKAGEGRKR